jgi:hypothetical protein
MTALFLCVELPTNNHNARSHDEHVVLLRVIRVLFALSGCFYRVLSGFAAQPSGLVIVLRLLGGREMPP